MDADEEFRRVAPKVLLDLGEFPKSVSHSADGPPMLPEDLLAELDILWPEAKPQLLAGLRSEKEIAWAASVLLALGREDTIPALIEALNRHGTEEIAEWYLNSGQPDLEKAARRWAETRGYTIVTMPGSPSLRWGGY